jgi:murein DD-endopeptidase MepM/ murein hydrolase activator NlpD
MSPRSARRSRVVAAGAGGFLAGAITMAVLAGELPSVLRSPSMSAHHPADRPLAADRKDRLPDDDGNRGVFEGRRNPVATPRPAVTPSILSSEPTPVIEADPRIELHDRRLELPVRGVVRRELRDSFFETRGSTRSHEAIDIMAPRDSPVLAVEDGTIARLFESKAGGTTVYQFDPTTRYVYYYAHLGRYADGLQEGHRVQRGQVLGYVGTSGNAPRDTPHLHFAIFRLTDKKRWWQGTPIDPYELLK